MVKGLLFILDCYVNGKNANEILSINEKELMEEIGMKNIVTSQRMNGFYSAIVLLKKHLTANLNSKQAWIFFRFYFAIILLKKN